MDKFSKLGNKKKPKDSTETLYDGGHLLVQKKLGYTYIDEPDSVCVVPILSQYNQILLRSEVIPPFNSRDGEPQHLTCIAGTIEEGESPEECLRRELVEESGIVLKDEVVIEFFDVLYKSKSGSSQFHMCILPLMEYQYDETVASGDGSKIEDMSKSVKIDIKYLNNLFPSDIVTSLLIKEVKKELNIQ